MRSFFQFFESYGNTLLFLLLEGICLYLIIQRGGTQQKIIFSTAHAAVAYWHKQAATIAQFTRAGDQIDDLLKENAELRAQVLRYTYEKQFSEKDTFRLGSDSKIVSFWQEGDSARYSFEFIPVKIINNSITGDYNIITIDRGKLSGVDKDMGVITKDGVIGIVQYATDHYASVMSLLHQDARLSAAIKRNGYFGSLIWRGKSSNKLYLEAIPSHVEVEKGDTIVTSGYSSLFPKGIVVGVVQSEKLQEDGSFKEIVVKLTSDFGNLKYAYVVVNKNQDEIKTVEQQGANE